MIVTFRRMQNLSLYLTHHPPEGEQWGHWAGKLTRNKGSSFLLHSWLWPHWSASKIPILSSLRPDPVQMPPCPRGDPDPEADQDQPPVLTRIDPVSGRAQTGRLNISWAVTPSRWHTMFSCASDFTGMKLLVCQAWQSTESDTGDAAPKATLSFKGGAKWVWWQLHSVGTGFCDPVSWRKWRISTFKRLCEGTLAAARSCPQLWVHHWSHKSLHPEPSCLIPECTVTTSCC